MHNTQRLISWPLVILLFSGFILRVWNLNFDGVPYPHPDELNYVPVARRMLETFDLNPHYFRNPPLVTYIFSLVYLIIYAFGHLIGFFPSWENFLVHLHQNSSVYYLASRIVIALLGTLSGAVLYLSCRKLFDQRVAILSVAFLSFCFLHVRDSHFAVNDVAMTFFLMASFYFTIGIFQNARLSQYLFAGLWAGLATAAKYNAGLIIVSILVAHLLRQEKSRGSGLIKIQIAGYACLFGFLLTCPWIFLDQKAFWGGFLKQMSFASSPWLGQSSENSYTQFIKVLLWGYGTVPFILACAGAWVLFRRKERSLAFFLLSFPVVYYLAMGQSRLFAARFTIPVLPFLCIFSGYALNALFVKLKLSGRKFLQWCILIIVFAQSIIFSARFDYLIGLKDTRIYAREWMVENLAEGSKIIKEGDEVFSPYLWDRKNKRYYKRFDGKAVWFNLADYTPQQYKQQGYEYLITTSFIRSRYESHPEQYSRQASFYDSLSEQAQEVYSLSPIEMGSDVLFYWDDAIAPFWNLFRLKMPGPTIKIYKL